MKKTVTIVLVMAAVLIVTAVFFRSSSTIAQPIPPAMDPDFPKGSWVWDTSKATAYTLYFPGYDAYSLKWTGNEGGNVKISWSNLTTGEGPFTLNAPFSRISSFGPEGKQIKLRPLAGITSFPVIEIRPEVRADSNYPFGTINSPMTGTYGFSPFYHDVSWVRTASSSYSNPSDLATIYILVGTENPRSFNSYPISNGETKIMGDYWVKYEGFYQVYNSCWWPCEGYYRYYPYLWVAAKDAEGVSSGIGSIKPITSEYIATLPAEEQPTVSALIPTFSFGETVPTSRSDVSTPPITPETVVGDSDVANTKFKFSEWTCRNGHGHFESGEVCARLGDWFSKATLFCKDKIGIEDFKVFGASLCDLGTVTPVIPLRPGVVIGGPSATSTRPVVKPSEIEENKPITPVAPKSFWQRLFGK